TSQPSCSHSFIPPPRPAGKLVGQASITMGGSSTFMLAPAMATTALILLLVLSSSPAVVAWKDSGLSVGFYRELCPKAEKVVRRVVTKAFKKEPGTPGDIIRLFFHDCFVRGCDASVLLESTPGNTAERDSKPNNPSLDGFEVISDAKEILEKLCPQTVSCADILALSARDGAFLASGLNYAIPTGRRDGLVSKADEVLPSVPHPDFHHDQLIGNFTAKGNGNISTYRHMVVVHNHILYAYILFLF
uniref:Peroxidase 1 n=1 Tax=Aegilops tauschii subsp. strangulata TaxID=200361 RepID=A0A452XWX4_AEGTS